MNEGGKDPARRDEIVCPRLAGYRTLYSGDCLKTG